MGKKLAFWGDCNGYGYKIIRILEELGGINVSNYAGNEVTLLYYIDKKNHIKGKYNGDLDKEKYVIMTYQDFITKYPFQVGDKVVDCYGNPVTIKSMKWSDDFETMVYDFEETEDVLCAEDIESVNDIHTKPSKMKIVLAELLEHIKTTPKEELEREFEEIEEWSNVGPTVEEFRTFCECVNKKPKYPNEYEECVRIAKNIHGYDIHIDAPAYRELMESFVKLLICRDAYWKIAGEEMRLGDSWKYDMSKDEFSCAISYQYGCIEKNEIRHKNAILAFPTKEMRDAFYENFKDLIEQCKELL